jgi:hypothetical protein
LPKLPYQMQGTAARKTDSVRPYRTTVTFSQSACSATAAGVPSLPPLSAGRPRLPVRGGARSYSAALAGNRVVHVVRDTSSGLP